MEEDEAILNLSIEIFMLNVKSEKDLIVIAFNKFKSFSCFLEIFSNFGGFIKFLITFKQKL